LIGARLIGACKSVIALIVCVAFGALAERSVADLIVGTVVCEFARACIAGVGGAIKTIIAMAVFGTF
jgi:hypothetical protein